MGPTYLYTSWFRWMLVPHIVSFPIKEACIKDLAPEAQAGWNNFT